MIIRSYLPIISSILIEKWNKIQRTWKFIVPLTCNCWTLKYIKSYKSLWLNWDARPYQIPMSFETLSYFQLSSSISLSNNLSLPSLSLCDSRTDCMNSFSACTLASAFSAISSLDRVLAITMECSSADVLPGVWKRIFRLELFMRAII